MKIRVPENISEITLLQFQKYMKLSERTDLNEIDFTRRVIEIFCNISHHDTVKIPAKDYKEILDVVKKAMDTDVEFTPRFFIKDIEFGFIPNLDKITFNEYRALSNFGTDAENLHLTMSVLFRPISKTDNFGNYKIDSYKGIEMYSEIMKFTPMNVVNGALAFFLNLQNELEKCTPNCIAKAQKRVEKHQTISVSGIGTLHG